MASLMTIGAAALIPLLLIWPLRAQNPGQSVVDKSGLSLVKPSDEETDITSQIKQEINDRVSEWLELYNSRDFTGLCNELYTEDCVMYMPDATEARGREECARAWETIEENDYLYATFKTSVMEDVIVTSADYVIETGVATDSEDQYVKYIAIWKRVGGKLYVFQNIDNANTPFKAPTLLDEITDRRNEMTYYFNGGNFESVCNVFTPDGWIAPPGAPPVSGRDGCKRLMVKMAISGAARMSEIPEVYEVYDLGDGFVLNHGGWIAYDQAGGQLDRGKDMKIWKRLDDGQCYILFDMWNSDIHF